MNKPEKRAAFTIWFENTTAKITRGSGSPRVVLFAILLIIVWAVTGPFFHFSATWQLVINTGTTIITFIMVFIIQHSQNKDSTAVQIKLDELLAAHDKASNRMVNIEDLTEEELLVMKKYYKKLSETLGDKDQYTSHSIDDLKPKRSKQGNENNK
jgi:low affinity Fe/Cu permease